MDIRLVFVLILGVYLYFSCKETCKKDEKKSTSTTEISKKSSSVLKEKFLPIYSFLTGASNRQYFLMRITHDILTKNNIPYAISGRALLYAALRGKLPRKEGKTLLLIPVDYIHQLLDLSQEFKNIGLGFNDLPDGSLLLSTSMSLAFLNDTSITIVPMQESNNEWFAVNNMYYERYLSKDLFPTKMYNLGNVVVMGPNNPIPYLENTFFNNGENLDEIDRYTKKTRYITRIPNSRILNHFPYYESNVDRENKIFAYRSDIDRVNGIIQDRNCKGQAYVIMGNGKRTLVPDIGVNSRFQYVK